MPKKTKKEKIIAQYRKKIKLLQLIQSVPQQPIISQSIAPKPSTPKLPNPIVQENQLISKYFYQDFKKSLIFIAVIITLEISLYFVRIIK